MARSETWRLKVEDRFWRFALWASDVAIVWAADWIFEVHLRHAVVWFIAVLFAFVREDEDDD